MMDWPSGKFSLVFQTSKVRDRRPERTVVIPGFMPGIQPSTNAGAS